MEHKLMMGRLRGRFVREVQAVADKCSSFEQAIEALTEWRCELKPHVRPDDLGSTPPDISRFRFSPVGFAHFYGPMKLVLHFRAWLRREGFDPDALDEAGRRAV
jgi:hypothetical protein